MRPHPRYSAAECSEAARDYPSTPSPSSNQRQNQAKLHRLQKRNSQSEFSALRQLLRATSVLHIRSNTPLFGYMLSVPICDISGNIFSPKDFTDFHRFGYMLSVFICDISGKCSFLPRISQIFTDLVTCYPCPFVTSVGIFFLPRISQIFTDLATCYPCSFVLSVGIFFSPTDFTDFHGFGYMLSVPICVISGKYFSPTDFTDLHGFGYMLSVFI